MPIFERARWMGNEKTASESAASLSQAKRVSSMCQLIILVCHHSNSLPLHDLMYDATTVTILNVYIILICVFYLHNVFFFSILSNFFDHNVFFSPQLFFSTLTFFFYEYFFSFFPIFHNFFFETCFFFHPNFFFLLKICFFSHDP